MPPPLSGSSKSRTFALGKRLSFASIEDWSRGALAAADLITTSVRRLEKATPSEARDSLGSWAARLFSKLGLQLEIRGLEHVGPGPYVIVATHEGFLDVPALLHLPLPLRFTVREELAEWPALGRGIAATDQIVIDTARPRSGYRHLLRKGAQAIGQSESVVMFPQGSVLGIEVAFARGAEGLAAHLGVPILPVVLTGSHLGWDYPFDTCVHFESSITMELMAPRHSVVGLEEDMRRLALDGLRSVPRRFVPERDGWWDGYSFEIAEEFADLRMAVLQRRSLSPTP